MSHDYIIKELEGKSAVGISENSLSEDIQQYIVLVTIIYAKNYTFQFILLFFNVLRSQFKDLNKKVQFI